MNDRLLRVLTTVAAAARAARTQMSSSDRGQSIAEYGVILAVVSLAIAAAAIWR